jgi:transposase
MSEKRQKFDRKSKDSAVRIVEETGKSIAQVARDLGVNEGTLRNRVAKAAGSPTTSARRADPVAAGSRCAADGA